MQHDDDDEFEGSFLALPGPAEDSFTPARPVEVPTAGLPTAGLPDLTGQRQWDLDALLDSLHRAARQKILFHLAAAGPVNVGTLARRTGIDQKTVSSHLTKLKDLGLLCKDPDGRFSIYQPISGRVEFQRQGEGFSLKIKRGRMAIIILEEPPDPEPAPVPSEGRPKE